MKRIALFFLLANSIFSQVIPFDYTIKLNPVTIPNLPGLHSFVAAQSGGYWLIIGGRTDGLHARQPFNAFAATGNNTNIYVIDVNSHQFWSQSVSSLSTGLQEQLQSTNMNFYQDADTLYITGGYGYSSTAADHITFPNLTAVHVSGLINAIISNASISSYFRQITDPTFAVTGAQLGKIDDTYYLVGGHRFDGRYNPMNNPTYTQTYVSGIQKFKLNNSGSQLSFSDYSVITDQVHLHRRDYNLVPQIFPNGESGYTISSGVFQTSVDLPFLYPVDITSNGYTPQPAFNQYLSNYHSAKCALYDSINNIMHSVFFGGMSQYAYLNNVLTQDNNVPFVKTISRVSRDSNGNLQENVFTEEMPSLIGASAEFITNHAIPHYETEIIKLSELSTDSVLAGHIYGGIYSSQLNPFANNNTAVTSAHNVIYEVWLVKNESTKLIPLNGKNPLTIDIFPNPVDVQATANITIPYNGDLLLLITDMQGKIIHTKKFEHLKKGPNKIQLLNETKLSSGTYTFNFVFEGKFTNVQKVIIQH